MEFWGNKVDVSKIAAQQQIAIIKTFSPEKRMKIALEFSSLGITRTREWIKERNPAFSELEISLEFVKLIYYEPGQMKEDVWQFYKNRMEHKIKKDWSKRFRKMMKDNNWNYDQIARMGGFKSGQVVKSTVSRGLPSFAKLAVVIYETMKKVEFK